MSEGRPAAALRLAVCGCGKVAEHHIRAADKFDAPVSIVAVIDRDESRCAGLRETFRESKVISADCVSFTSLDSALASKRKDGSDRPLFDAVALLLPHNLHQTAAVSALEARRHVLLEKPMAPSLPECERILAAAKSANEANIKENGTEVIFAVAENGSFWPEVQIARELIREGAIGEVVTARAHYYEALSGTPFGGSDGQKATEEEEPKDDVGWRADTAIAGGGIVMDGGFHWIRALRECMGEVEEVVAVTANPLGGGDAVYGGRKYMQFQGESLAHAMFRHASGKYSSYQATLLSSAAVMAHGANPWVRVTGHEGEIVVSGDFGGGVTLYNKRHPEGADAGGRRGGAKGFMDSFGPQMINFASVCLAAAGAQGKGQGTGKGEMESSSGGSGPDRAKRQKLDDSGESPTLLRPPEYALGELRVAQAIYRSATTKSWEKCTA